MFILSKKRFEFRNANNETFTTKGGMAMEEAPDWCADNDFFKAAESDGDIIVATAPTEKAATQAVTAAETKTAATQAVTAAETKTAAKATTAKIKA